MRYIMLFVLLTTSAIGQVAPMLCATMRPTPTDGSWGSVIGYSQFDPRTAVWTKGRTFSCAPIQEFRVHDHYSNIGCLVAHGEGERCSWTYTRCVEVDCLSPHWTEEIGKRCRSTGKSATTTGTDREWTWEAEGIVIWVHEEAR